MLLAPAAFEFSSSILARLLYLAFLCGRIARHLASHMSTRKGGRKSDQHLFSAKRGTPSPCPLWLNATAPHHAIPDFGVASEADNFVCGAKTTWRDARPPSGLLSTRRLSRAACLLGMPAHRHTFYPRHGKHVLVCIGPSLRLRCIDEIRVRRYQAATTGSHEACLRLAHRRGAIDAQWVTQ